MKSGVLLFASLIFGLVAFDTRATDSDLSCTDFLRYADKEIPYYERRGAVLNFEGCDQKVSSLRKRNPDFLWDTNWQRFASAIQGSPFTESPITEKTYNKKTDQQPGNEFKDWEALLHASRTTPITISGKNYCGVWMRDLHGKFYKEQGDFSYASGENSIKFEECNSDNVWEVSYDALGDWVNREVNRSPRVFDTSLPQAASINNWTDDQMKREYVERFNAVLGIVNERYDGKLDLWRRRAEDVDFVWQTATLVNRLSWVCENVFNDDAVEQASAIASTLGVSSEGLCGTMLDSFLENDISELSERISASVSLDPSKIVRLGKFSPNDIAYLHFALGYLPLQNKQIKGNWLDQKKGSGLGFTSLGLHGAVAQSMVLMAENVMFTAWHGFEPPTPFTFYRDQVQSATKEFLFANINNFSDIDSRLAETDLNPEDFAFLLSIIDGLPFDSKSTRILSVYKDKFGDYESLAAKQEELAARELEEQQKREYIEAYLLFATVEACYAARREYAVQYITIGQFRTAKTKWSEVKGEFDLEDTARDEAESELEESDAYRLFITATSSPQYSDQNAQDCSMALTTLNLR